MSVDEVSGPARPDPAPRDRRGEGSFADRWPFRRKVSVLVGVPLVVIGLLIAYAISGLVGQAQGAAADAQLVRDSRPVTELVDRLQSEHQQALLLSLRYEAATPGEHPSAAAYRKAQAAVDAQVDKVRQTFGARLSANEAHALKEIGGLGSLRTTVERGYLPLAGIDHGYLSPVNGLIDGLGLVHAMNDTITAIQLDSLLHATASYKDFETAVFSAQTGDGDALIEYNAAVGDTQLYGYQTARFGRFSTEAQSTELARVQQTPTWNSILQQYAAMQTDPSALKAQGQDELRKTFAKALRAYPDYQAQGANRLRITGSLIGQIADHVDQTSSRAWSRAAWLLGSALLGFALWLAFSVVIRRSVIRPVQALTAAATQVADVAGEELARVADDDDDDASPPRLRKMPVTARDEIGDLADAFNRVQTAAAALLERQVLSRRNVAEMFGNVGRRVSNLTMRQLLLIDAVERGETNPDLLDHLYRIDHLAVRLQRNADSLMLLAGVRETGLDFGPTALTDVVRAALGQIEGFQRVSLSGDRDVTVGPDIVADLTLLIAELLENAVAFSPSGSPVEVWVRTRPEGALIEISDHGLGMSEERLAEENARLIRRERLDLVPTKVLGLFVVGNLARRWGVRVTLSPTPGGGVTSRVALPSALLLQMSPLAEDSDRAHEANDATVGGKSALSVPSSAEPRPSAPAHPAPALLQRRAALPPAEDHRRPEAAPLPQRVPQNRHPSGVRAGGATEPLPAEPAVQHPAGELEAGGPRPLNRRVRGATLRATLGETGGHAVREAPRIADADAVRSELDDFEAAVERAHRDTSDGTAPNNTQRQAAFPEGAEQ
ncbi:ATP-binding protein [Streptomyces sp. NPDC051104]|uniref:ATP-binding protein n=1 Tax=Streptomyces sp. NPDC051104 TaxID=3155044 RepID=UPI00342F10C9